MSHHPVASKDQKPKLTSLTRQTRVLRYPKNEHLIEKCIIEQIIENLVVAYLIHTSLSLFFDFCW